MPDVNQPQPANSPNDQPLNSPGAQPGAATPPTPPAENVPPAPVPPPDSNPPAPEPPAPTDQPTAQPPTNPEPPAAPEESKPEPPSANEPEPSKQEEQAPQASGQARGVVLIADDDITLRDMYQTRLETEGYNVLVAADGEEALNMIRQKKPNMVLLDIMMPKMNGLDVLAEMKKDAELKKIPVIILTALIQDLTKVKSLLTGADDYLMKSEVMPGEVIKKVTNVLEKTKQQ